MTKQRNPIESAKSVFGKDFREGMQAYVDEAGEILKPMLDHFAGLGLIPESPAEEEKPVQIVPNADYVRQYRVRRTSGKAIQFVEDEEGVGNFNAFVTALRGHRIAFTVCEEGHVHLVNEITPGWTRVKNGDFLEIGEEDGPAGIKWGIVTPAQFQELYHLNYGQMDHGTEDDEEDDD